jgi:hypothetical protein
MPIDFLEGKVKKPVIKKEAAPDVAMHAPVMEPKIIAAKEVKKEAPKPQAKPVSSEENIEEVNLVNSFRSHVFKRRLTFSGIFVIIMLLIAGLFYYFFTRIPVSSVVNTNVQIKQNLNLAQPNVNIVTNDNLNIENLNITTNVNLEPVILPPINEAPPIVLLPVVLPDTELAPLRGALVRFAGEDKVNLVETNGELRIIEQSTVIFENGQSLKKINQAYIYLIPDRFKDIRRGKDVRGQVDFDPRVLKPEELAPFKF